MSSRIVRTTLTLLAVAAIGTAAYFYWTTLARMNASLQDASAFTQVRDTATQAAYELRSSQQAYIAAGQNEAFWFERATRSLDTLRTALNALQSQGRSEAVRTVLSDVSKAADEFEARDRRVRTYVSGGQKLLAADLIFSEGFDLTARIVTGLSAAGDQTALEGAQARAAAAREQKIAAGSAAAVVVLLVVLLGSMGRPASIPVDHARTEARPEREGMLNLDIRPARTPANEAVPAARSGKVTASSRTDPRKPAITTRTASESSAGTAPPSVSAVPSVAPAIPPVGLEKLAAVCADLARLSDTSAIPAILERTASALDASGLVLWIADDERGELLPIAAHGYAPSVLSRMGGLSKDSENATAAAFRTGLLQTVRGNSGTNGAIAAPLVSPAGPLGVLSLEMRQEEVKRLERQAAATIIASQLATIVGHPIDRSTDLQSTDLQSTDRLISDRPMG